MSKVDLSLKIFETTINLQTSEHGKIGKALSSGLVKQIEDVCQVFSMFFQEEKLVGLKPLHFSASHICLNLDFCSDETIQVLNAQYRGKDKVTDVLSFPVHEDLRLNVDPMVLKSEMLLIGDIFICENVAINQAKEAKISLETEIIELFIHGVLHLLGYDHEASEDEEKIMYSIERDIFNSYTNRVEGEE